MNPCNYDAAQNHLECGKEACPMAQMEHETEDDLPFEEQVLRAPHSVKSWLAYISAKLERKRPPKEVNLVYERAVERLPGSYKLWHGYLQYRRAQVDGRDPSSRLFEALNNTYERAMVFMNKMPRIWEEYCEFLVHQGMVTRSRRTFDRALKALPVTQHHRIWVLYLEFVQHVGIPEVAIRVYRRYLKGIRGGEKGETWRIMKRSGTMGDFSGSSLQYGKLDADEVEAYVEYLMRAERWGEAAVQLSQALSRSGFKSKKGKSSHQLWLELCQIVATHPAECIKRLRVEPIIRSGIRLYSDEVGRLWTALADHHIRLAEFEKARNVYEEAIQEVRTVADFSMVFDAYSAFEESMINARMSMLEDGEGEGGENAEAEDVDLDLRMARLEHLLARRPLLVNSVLLRQNPHNVQQWEKRVELHKGHPEKIVLTYTEALQTINPHEETSGHTYSLWIAFAKYYEDAGDLESARQVWEKAVQADYKSVGGLAQVYCAWVEMELRVKNYKGARDVLARATQPGQPDVDYWDDSVPVQERLFKNVKVWAMYADVEESLGTLESTKAVYERILDLKVATPQMVINYAAFLEEKQYFEASFRALERGVQLFVWPHVKPLWQTYLTKLVQRYVCVGIDDKERKSAQGKKKIERARDLFEQCLDTVPPHEAKMFFCMYAKLEEEYGLARHAMAIYDRAARIVPKEQRFEMYKLYIARASKFFGVAQTRKIYERAIEMLEDNDEQARDMCLSFADLERNLGELDRARAIFVHASQYCDPRTDKIFWPAWHQFEVRHGNVDTFKDMLRVKRSVQAQFNLSTNMAGAAVALGSVAEGAQDTSNTADHMRAIEAEAMANQGPAGFVSAGKLEGTKEEQGKEPEMEANPDEVDLGDEDESDEDEKEEDKGKQPMSEDMEEIGFERLPIPKTVFGDALEAAAREKREREKSTKESVKQQAEGALERLRKKKKLA